MSLSVFDLFKIGIGPSSSHTVGPMIAARRFAEGAEHSVEAGSRIRVELFGSLGHTGRGHGTDNAVILGLCGFEPATLDPDAVRGIVSEVRNGHSVVFPGGATVELHPDTDLIFHKRSRLPHHSNGMRFTLFGADGSESVSKDYYSVGGGFVVNADEAAGDRIVADETPLPLHFASGDELLELCEQHGMTIAELMMTNEDAWRSRDETVAGLMDIWQAMQSCVERGVASDGFLPGALGVRRRAPAMALELERKAAADIHDPLTTLDWVSLYALAVNEENAAGGRVVTAPTNGAAGVVPAVLMYYRHFIPGASDDGVIDFLLTAAAIGILYKENASISGAEVGCQGEVGVACSMAAAGLAAVRGGTVAQVENAAEIGMEHNLGLTCDPVGGLVQIPCIERNAMGAVKAINASRLALRGDGSHRVSLDRVIKTMRDTGADMKTKYKETSRGGLAVNVIEC